MYNLILAKKAERERERDCDCKKDIIEIALPLSEHLE
jgi:hypothetical protein